MVMKCAVGVTVFKTNAQAVVVSDFIAAAFSFTHSISIYDTACTKTQHSLSMTTLSVEPERSSHGRRGARTSREGAHAMTRDGHDFALFKQLVSLAYDHVGLPTQLAFFGRALMCGNHAMRCSHRLRLGLGHLFWHGNVCSIGGGAWGPLKQWRSYVTERRWFSPRGRHPLRKATVVVNRSHYVVHDGEADPQAAVV